MWMPRDHPALLLAHHSAALVLSNRARRHDHPASISLAKNRLSKSLFSPAWSHRVVSVIAEVQVFLRLGYLPIVSGGRVIGHRSRHHRTVRPERRNSPADFTASETTWSRLATVPSLLIRSENQSIGKRSMGSRTFRPSRCWIGRQPTGPERWRDVIRERRPDLSPFHLPCTQCGPVLAPRAGC